MANFFVTPLIVADVSVDEGTIFRVVQVRQGGEEVVGKRGEIDSNCFVAR